MKSKSSVFCNETCIVVDHNQSFLNPSGSKINLDPVQKRSAKDSFLHGLAKSSWTCVVEGISEYCRIVFDLFDTTCKVNTVPLCFINCCYPCLKLILLLAKSKLVPFKYTTDIFTWYTPITPLGVHRFTLIWLFCVIFMRSFHILFCESE